MNSTADFGYFPEPQPLTVKIGDTFRQRCAVGVAEYSVLRRHHTPGWFEVRFESWVTEPDHPSRHSRVGTIDALDGIDILKAMRAA